MNIILKNGSGEIEEKYKSPISTLSPYKVNKKTDALILVIAALE